MKLRTPNKTLAAYSSEHIIDLDLHSFLRTLIHDMLPIMNPDDDYLTIVAAEDKIASSEAKRKKELEVVHTNLNLKCLFLSRSCFLLISTTNET